MPCWYYEKKELKNTPSYVDSIDSLTESRYRREGARFIFDAGTKMGLRYDSCATGVVYFHRFYMFHSFKEFHRYVTGACCLFLAGKVEETPKKCKDIIKTCRSLLTEQQFSVFGEDPREEVMTLERILLQTIKFDLQVEHPYTRLLHYAKLLKGDKQKIQKVVQMAWTFINDSMCTMLCLQWEPDIISVSMLYLATRLSKLDIQDWVGKPPGSKLKWWEGLVEDLSQELIEEICHQVLDLYSSKSQKREESPPILTIQKPEGKRNRNSSPLDDRLPIKERGGKSLKLDKSHEEPSRRFSKGHPDVSHGAQPPFSGAPPTSYSGPPPSATSGVNTRSGGHHPGNPPYAGADNSNYNQFNPYGSSQQFSSFMSQEGSQSIQSLITGGDGGSQPYTDAPPSDYQNYQPPGYQPPGYGNNPPPAAQSYPPPPQPYAGYHPPPASYPPAPGAPNQPPQGYPGGAYQNHPPQPFNYNQDFNQQGYPQSFPPAGPPGFQNNTYGPPRGPPPKNVKNKKPEPPNSCLAQVRITGR